MVVYLMVGDLADPAAEERGGLAWGVRREEPNRDAHGLAAFFFLEWIGGTAMILFFSRLSFSATVRWNKELLAGFSLGLAGLEG
jgi:hypothetical protein